MARFGEIWNCSYEDIKVCHTFASYFDESIRRITFNHQGGDLSHKQHSLVLSFNWNYDLINKKSAMSLITHCAVHVFIHN